LKKISREEEELSEIIDLSNENPESVAPSDSPESPEITEESPE